MFRKKASFYNEELSTLPQTPKLEDLSLSAARDCLFNIFAATLHIRCATSWTVPGSIPGGVTGFFSDTFPSD